MVHRWLHSLWRAHVRLKAAVPQNFRTPVKLSELPTNISRAPANSCSRYVTTWPPVWIKKACTSYFFKSRVNLSETFCCFLSGSLQQKLVITDSSRHITITSSTLSFFNPKNRLFLIQSSMSELAGKLYCRNTRLRQQKPKITPPKHVI